MSHKARIQTFHSWCFLGLELEEVVFSALFPSLRNLKAATCRAREGEELESLALELCTGEANVSWQRL